jgi:hypothetical protein
MADFVGGAMAEACISKPWVVIPMVLTNAQDYIAAGQFGGGEQLVEAQQVARPGTICEHRGRPRLQH